MRKTKEPYNPAAHEELLRIIKVVPGIGDDQLEETMRENFTLDEYLGALDKARGNLGHGHHRLSSEVVYQVDRSGPGGRRVGRRFYLRENAPGEEIPFVIDALNAEGANELLTETLKNFNLGTPLRKLMRAASNILNIRR